MIQTDLIQTTNNTFCRSMQWRKHLKLQDLISQLPKSTDCKYLNLWLQTSTKKLQITNTTICNYNRSLAQVTSANSRKHGMMNYCTDSSVIQLRDTAAGNCYFQITAAPNCQASMAPHTPCAPPHLPCTSLLHLKGVTVHLTPVFMIGLSHAMLTSIQLMHVHSPLVPYRQPDTYDNGPSEQSQQESWLQ